MSTVITLTSGVNIALTLHQFIWDYKEHICFWKVSYSFLWQYTYLRHCIGLKPKVARLTFFNLLQSKEEIKVHTGDACIFLVAKYCNWGKLHFCAYLDSNFWKSLLPFLWKHLLHLNFGSPVPRKKTEYVSQDKKWIFSNWFYIINSS